MINSLQDQLIKTGLANAKQAKKGKPARGPKKKKKDRQDHVLSDSAQAAQRAMTEKATRDRALNRQREQAAERKAIMGQIRQLIEQNRLPRDKADLGYHFQDGNKIRKLHVTPPMHEQLSQGCLAIVKLQGQYDVVPVGVAEKIRERNASCVVVLHTPEAGKTEDDHYADHPIPDDLMW